MDKNIAEIIGKKARALKHCEKLLAQIEKSGSAKIKLNCTGVEFVVHQGDAIYLTLQKQKYALICDIQSYDITLRAKSDVAVRRKATSPTEATAETSDKLAEKRAKQREYMRRYNAKKKLLET